MVFIRKKSLHTSKSVSILTYGQAITLPLLMAGLLIIFSIVVVVMPGSLQANPLTARFNSSDIDFKRYCGRSLADLMVLICGENIRSVSSKSNEGGSIYDCCRHPCGYDQLKSYCPEE